MDRYIPEGWKEVKLGDIGDAIIGLTYSPKDIRSDGFLVLRSSNVKNSKIVNADNVYVSLDLNDKIKTRAGDILICSRNGSRSLIGKNALITKEFEGQTFGAFMTLYRSQYNNILQHFFKTDLFQRQVEQNLGPTINQITSGNFNSFKVLLPRCLEEQNRIVEVLESWDDMISALEDKCEKLATYKKALMQKLLTPQSHWEEGRLDSMGKVITGNTPSKTDASNYGSDSCWATAEDFGSKYIFNTKVKLSEKGEKLARIVPKNSILVSCIGTLGLNAISKVDTATNQQINAISVYENNSYEFLYYLICFNEKLLKQYAGNGGMMILNKSTFESIKFKTPPLPEQEEIANTLSQVDEYIDLTKQQLANYKDQKKALMQKLLTGEWRV